MGQYFMAVNIDRQECVDPHDYHMGAKLTEHAWLLNPFVNAVMDLLTPGGPWHTSRVVWARDYMDKGLFMKRIKNKRSEDETLYDCCCEGRYGSRCINRIVPSRKDGPLPGYLVNHTRKTYLVLPVRFTFEEWVVHPLPILTCSGNGKGGGDYPFNNPYVGAWAGHVISVEYKTPLIYKECNPAFESDM